MFRTIHPYTFNPHIVSTYVAHGATNQFGTLKITKSEPYEPEKHVHSLIGAWGDSLLKCAYVPHCTFSMFASNLVY